MNFSQDMYYFYCCAGLGDTMLICGFKDALERKYSSPICLIVKKSHMFIAEMYGIRDYLVIGKDISASTLKKGCVRTPQKGKIYAAHPCNHPELRGFFDPVRYQVSTMKFLPWFRKFLDIDPSEKLMLPKRYPQMDASLRNCCEHFAPVSDIVLFSPEATSVLDLPDLFWENKARALCEKGFTVISNVIDPANTVAGTKYLKISVEETVALALECHSVYSLRSGLCDLLFSMGDRLHVYYPSYSSLFLYSLNDMFDTMNIDEELEMV